MRIEQMEQYAKENDIPIIEKESIEYINKYILDNNIKTIIEIGSAIGYSAIKMALVRDDIKVVTFERDELRYEEAIKNIKEMGLENRIEVLNIDALDTNIYDKFDMLFIDGAKSQYINFFNKYENNINDNGVIIADNLKFHGLVSKYDEITSKNVRGIVKKITNFVDFLKENNEYDTEFVDVGDGISISKKKPQ
ncbi:MAG: O-methyltransferase [Bacilli bacterium]|nr:O-methyltransferase [Bacilli bacterium]MDD4733782.1 O-methyltransferase [Bacilli bacterium]